METTGLATGAIACPVSAESIEQSMVAEQRPDWVAKKIEEHRGPRPQQSQQSVRAQHAQTTKDLQTVMDVVSGVNLRWKDNVIQAVVIAVSTVLGVPIGWGVALWMRAEPIGGLFLDGFGGLLFGLFASGIVIMIYRMFRH